MSTHPLSTAALLLRLSLGALSLSFACLTLAALCAPAFAADLAAQGMPAPLTSWAMLLELAGGLALVLGVHGRAPAPRSAMIAGAKEKALSPFRVEAADCRSKKVLR